MNHDVTISGRIRRWAFFLLIVYAPLPLASNRPWALALLGLLTGGLLIWNIFCAKAGAMLLAWQKARIPLLLLGMWMALLAIQIVPLPIAWTDALDQRALRGFTGQDRAFATISIDPYSTRLYLIKAVILTAVCWLALTLINARQHVKWLARVVVFSGLLQAMIGVVLMASGASFLMFFVDMSNPRGHGTFVSPNNFAGYLELTLAVGIGFMIAKLDGHAAASWRQRLHGWLALLISEKALLRLSLIIMVVGLVASRSRMGNAAFFASLLIVGTFTILFAKHATQHVQDRRGKSTLRATIFFITSLIVLDVFIIGGVVGVEKVVQRLEDTNLKMQTENTQTGASGGVVRAYHQEASVEERSEAARYALPIVRDFPWLGTGGGTFHLTFQHYQPSGWEGYQDHVHNDFVEFASEVGLTGFLLLVLMVAHSVWCSVRLLLHSHDQLARGMAFASLMGITSLLIHGAVDFNLQIPATAMLFLIVLWLPYLLRGLKR